MLISYLLGLKTKPLSIAEIESKILNKEAIPGIFKINDAAEEVKDKSESKQKTVVRPWMVNKKPSPKEETNMENKNEEKSNLDDKKEESAKEETQNIKKE